MELNDLRWAPLFLAPTTMQGILLTQYVDDALNAWWGDFPISI